MDLVFFGTAEFAVPALEALIKSRHKVKLCVTQPDRKRGRGQAVGVLPIKRCSQAHHIPLFQPESLTDSDVVKKLEETFVDVFVVAAYGLKLTRDILALPIKACINIHASLLPRYRGAAPVQWAIAHGETETGITLMRMNETIDAGGIFLQKKTTIGKTETSPELLHRLSVIAAEILPDFLSRWEHESIPEIPQESHAATRAPRLRKSDGLINWKWSAHEIDRRVRAMQPWPSAHILWKGKLLKILRGAVVPSAAGGDPGMITVAESGIDVSCQTGVYRIKELQLESARAMSAADFVRGRKISTGEKFTP